MTSSTSAPTSAKSLSFSSLQRDPRYQAAVAQAARIKCVQLVRTGWLRPGRPRSQACSGQWKPRMDLIDDPSSPNIIALFELPGVKNDSITLQIKDRQLVVFGNRADPFAEAVAAAARARISESTTNMAHDTMQVDSNASNAAPTTLDTPANSTRELRYGSFYRTIPVPDGIKQAEVTAGLQDGMLTVSWPRVPAAARQPTAPVSTQGNPIKDDGITVPQANKPALP